MDSSRFEAPAGGEPGARQPRGERPTQSGRRPPQTEPLVNAPWAVVLLLTVIIAGYAAQSRLPIETAAALFALTPEHLADGHWERLLTSQFAHGNWAHALLNAAFILAFGAPVARFFGPRAGGVILFFAFYLACGALAGLAFVGLHLAEPVALLGASGAASGLMGAASRLIAGHGTVGPILSRPVASMAASWLVVNILMAVFGSALIPGAGDAAIGWEAHLAGFAAGVLLIAPFGWFVRRS
jgi:membrane associated rhomboid family serine protease